MIILAGKRLALYDKHFIVPRGPNRAAQLTFRGNRQAHVISRKFPTEENQESQQLVDDASRFTRVSGKNIVPLKTVQRLRAIAV